MQGRLTMALRADQWISLPVPQPVDRQPVNVAKLLRALASMQFSKEITVRLKLKSSDSRGYITRLVAKPDQQAAYAEYAVSKWR